MASVLAYLTPVPRTRIDAAAEQRAKITRWASRHRVRVGGWYEERAVGDGSIYSARPALMDALARLRGHDDSGTLLVASRDLFDVFDQAIIERLARDGGGRIVAADGKSASGDVLRLVSLLESHERALASTRTRAVRREREAEGLPFGVVAWGYRRSADGTRVLRDPKEQRVLAVAAHMRANGFTLREITEELARLDLRSRRGRRIGITRVFEILRDIESNPRYAPYRKILQRGSSTAAG